MSGSGVEDGRERERWSGLRADLLPPPYDREPRKFRTEMVGDALMVVKYPDVDGGQMWLPLMPDPDPETKPEEQWGAMIGGWFWTNMRENLIMRRFDREEKERVLEFLDVLPPLVAVYLAMERKELDVERDFGHLDRSKSRIVAGMWGGSRAGKSMLLAMAAYRYGEEIVDFDSVSWNTASVYGKEFERLGVERSASVGEYRRVVDELLARNTGRMNAPEPERSMKQVLEELVERYRRGDPKWLWLDTHGLSPLHPNRPSHIYDFALPNSLDVLCRVGEGGGGMTDGEMEDFLENLEFYKYAAGWMEDFALTKREYYRSLIERELPA